MASLPRDLVLMGDFNLYIKSSSSDVRQLAGILEFFDLNQPVSFPTHLYGHSPDVMISSKGCDLGAMMRQHKIDLQAACEIRAVSTPSPGRSYTA